MDLECACQDLKELGVIDEKILYNAIIEQGPKGEEGRLYKQQGIIYEKITHLRLEYLDILKIDHLWILTGLKKLQLCNNAIEKIENLNFLENLRELDLSFNFIKRIENLEALSNLEVLTLYQNKIEKIENLERLTNLSVFSVGNNMIEDRNSVFYLRGFKNLKSLNMAGNPICESENFINFVVAYLPQLVYYEYKMIYKSQREKAREIFYYDLVKLEREEEEIQLVREMQKKEKQQECINAEAFVEFLGGSQLFLSLFEKDSDSRTLLEMGESAKDVYNEYKKNFDEITKELHDFGLKQLQTRKEEKRRFEKYVGEAKERAFNKSRAIVEEFLEQKIVIFNQIKKILNIEVEDEDTANEVSFNVQIANETFKDLCHRTWLVLMREELNLFEASEEVNGTYERSLTEMVNQFIEGAQAEFTQMRQLQGSFNESLTDVANKFFTNYTVSTATGNVNEFKRLPPELINMMQDKEALMNALSASHDYHLLLIDQREDKMVSGIKLWLSELIETLITSEINRSRNAVTEINHFLDIQKQELQDLLSTPVGLLLLPREIQDALQM